VGAGADWFSSHSNGTRVLVLFLCFVSAPGIGWLVAHGIYGRSLLAHAGITFPLLLVLILGYKVWGAFVVGEMTWQLFGGFFAWAMRFFFSRQKKDAQKAMDALHAALADKDRIESLLERLRARASVFRRLGIVLGLAAGLVVGLFVPEGPGLAATIALYALIGAAYGSILTRLGESGLLLLPFQDN
jgi:hypothetical protein